MEGFLANPVTHIDFVSIMHKVFVCLSYMFQMYIDNINGEIYNGIILYIYTKGINSPFLNMLIFLVN